MSPSTLRDRDAIVTREGLVFRVLGYSHPASACISDLEYAPAQLFRTDNPKAPRTGKGHLFNKFYEDEGWKFLATRFPQYLVFHEMLRKNTVAVNHELIQEVRRPQEKLQELMAEKPADELHAAIQSLMESITQHAGLMVQDFGVFGSVLHSFHHPKLSDIDLVIYGRKKVAKLREELSELYKDKASPVKNEFESEASIAGKCWRFRNLSPKEFVWHQHRKPVYGLFYDKASGRTIKTEFEPVKEWKEIRNEYDSKVRILQKGWARLLARVTDDAEAPFIPSVYGVEPLKILEGEKGANEVARVTSYIEEFRMQVWRGENVYVEGNLEEVNTGKRSFHQIALTYCPRYYEQVLKVLSCA